jgi:hypothetical protein
MFLATTPFLAKRIWTATILGICLCVSQVHAQPKPQFGARSELALDFRIGGKPVPPEIFRDMGDGDLADSREIITAVDLNAARSSNLYADPITQQGEWVVQAASRGDESAYQFKGETSNHLFVVVTRFSGGGSGVFYNLRLLDLVSGHAIGTDGELYDRANLVSVQTVPLGDRWQGKVSVDQNLIAIAGMSAVDQPNACRTRTILARRP